MSAAARSCGPQFSPRGRWTQVPPTAVQAQLRLAFGRWGRPERFRVDNGVPRGSWGDLPTDLASWLIGLEVGVDWNFPARPQDNAERREGVGGPPSVPYRGKKGDQALPVFCAIRSVSGLENRPWPGRHSVFVTIAFTTAIA